MSKYQKVTINSPNLSWVIVNSFFVDYTPATISLEYGDIIVLVDKWEKRGRSWISFIYRGESSIYFEKIGNFYYVNKQKCGIDLIDNIDQKNIDDQLIYISQKISFSQKNINFVNELAPFLQIFQSHIAINKETQYISQFHNLEFLDLCGSHITNQGVKNLKQLENIKGMNFEETTISNNGLQYLSSLKKLQFLNLQNTAINDEGIGKIDNELQCINVRSTNIGDKAIAKIVNFKYLNMFKLQKCPISNKSLEYLAQCKNLRALALGWISLSNTNILAYLHTISMLQFTRMELLADDFHWVGNLPNLKSLYFWKILLEKDSLNCLKNCQKIEKLFLRWVNIEGIPFNQLGKLKQLQTISFRGTNIIDKNLYYLLPLENLTKLDLTNTQVTDLGIKILINLPKLDCLFLWKTKITNSAVITLSNFHQLKVLDISQTLITKKAVQQLKNNLPNCLIYY